MAYVIKKRDDETEEEYQRRKKRVMSQRRSDHLPMNNMMSSHGGNPYPDVPVSYDCSVLMSCTAPTDCTMVNPNKP